MREVQISKQDLRIVRIFEVVLPPLAAGAARNRCCSGRSTHPAGGPRIVRTKGIRERS